MKRLVWLAGLMAIAMALSGCVYQNESLQTAKEYCEKTGQSHCDCGFEKISESELNIPKTLEEFEQRGFNCPVSADVTIYHFDPCFYCGIACVPEHGTTYYFVSDKVEALFEVPWGAEDPETGVEVQNICIEK